MGIEAIDFIFEPLSMNLWYIGFIVLIGVGLWFTFRLRFFQILKLKNNAHLALLDSSTDDDDKHHKNTVSQFEAFCISLGTRMGTGNIAGIATAIVTGGPGAIFWMWVFATIGAASSFVESTLAQIYKERDETGAYHGGPAYYALKGLGSRKIAFTIAIISVLTFSIGFIGSQSCYASMALKDALNIGEGDLTITLIMTVISAVIVFGGVSRVAKFSSKVVPFIALSWILFAFVCLIINFSNIPNAFAMIFTDAFSMDAAIGGGIGTAIMVGLRRGVFSNEAGLGSIPNIAGISSTTHPAKQGFIQSFGVLIDTMVVCTITALVILSYGDWSEISALSTFSEGGAPLIQSIMSVSLHGGFIAIVIAFFMLVFAITSIIGCYTMSESNMSFLTKRRFCHFMLRILVIVVIFFASISDITSMNYVTDTFTAILGVTNAILLILLSKQAFAAFDDYWEQKKAGVESPSFHKDVLERTDGITEWD